MGSVSQDVRTYARTWGHVTSFLVRDLLLKRDRCRRFAGEVLAFAGQRRLDAWLRAEALSSILPEITGVGVELVDPWPVYGNVAAAELVALCLIARATAARSVLEIGTFDGATAINLALNLSPDGVVYSLDLSSSEQATRRRSEPGWVWDRHPIGQRRPIPEEVGRRVRFLEGDSLTFDFRPLHSAIDLVFVDGSHQYDHVVADSVNALRCVSPRGCVVWHDAAPSKVGVVGALRGLTVPLRRIEGTTLAIYKRPIS